MDEWMHVWVPRFKRDPYHDTTAQFVSRLNGHVCMQLYY